MRGGRYVDQGRPEIMDCKGSGEAVFSGGSVNKLNFDDFESVGEAGNGEFVHYNAPGSVWPATLDHPGGRGRRLGRSSPVPGKAGGGQTSSVETFGGPEDSRLTFTFL